MSFSETELIESLLKTLDQLREHKVYNDSSISKLANYFYIPNEKINNLLSELQRLIEISKNPTERRKIRGFNNVIGRILEQIAFLGFKGLKGVSILKSFQSAGPQYDLIASGNDEQWLSICNQFLGDNRLYDIVIEAKATQSKVNDQQFARLCSILQHNLFSSSGMGIFFTLNGATGFPNKDTKRRQNALQSARLRQVLFMAQCNKPILVFDLDDILSLDKKGSLFKLILQKIRDIEQQSGVYLPPDIDEPFECDLPSHLMELQYSEIP